MKEIWLPIRGFVGYYEVSNYGAVRSMSRIVIRSNGSPYRVSERIIKNRNHSSGYRAVTLAKNAEFSTYLVHRLVADAFLGRSEMQVAHWDGDKENNKLTNLRYATAKENAADSIRLGTIPRGELKGNSKLTEDDVVAIRGASGTQESIGKKFGVTQTLVGMVRRKEIWRHI